MKVGTSWLVLCVLGACWMVTACTGVGDHLVGTARDIDGGARPDSTPPDALPNDSAPTDASPTDSMDDTGDVVEGGGVVCPASCDDGNPCNGVERCDSTTGRCQPGESIVCDDGDACNGIESCDPATGVCVGEVFPACPVAPPECEQNGGTGSPTVGRIETATAGGFRLVDDDGWVSSESLVDQVATHWSVTPVTLGDVLGNMNRVGAQVFDVAGTECYQSGFEWNAGDSGVAYWYPQGVTGSGDAFDDGLYQGRNIGMASWYHRPENDNAGSPDKGVRISIYDSTNLADIRYRHVLLVVPVMNGVTPDFQRVPVHAGGIVWYHNYLYVADTTNGFRVFDLTRILQVQTGNADWLGKVSEAEGYHAFNYRYVVPQVSRYRLCGGSCCARFSFVSLDRSTTPHSLLSGEYSTNSGAGRLHRWPLDEITGRMLMMGGRVQSTEAVFPGVENMQGGLSWEGQYFVSCSGDFLGLHTGQLGQPTVERGWPYGPEDLYYSPGSDHLWSLTEHLGTRAVFTVNRAAIQAGCPR